MKIVSVSFVGLHYIQVNFRICTDDFPIISCASKREFSFKKWEFLGLSKKIDIKIKEIFLTAPEIAF